MLESEQTKPSRTKQSRIAKYSQTKQSQENRQNSPRKTGKRVADKIVRTKQRVKHMHTNEQRNHSSYSYKCNSLNKY